MLTGTRRTANRSSFRMCVDDVPLANLFADQHLDGHVRDPTPDENPLEPRVAGKAGAYRSKRRENGNEPSIGHVVDPSQTRRHHLPKN
jgi:hypothetical protein